MIALIVIGGIVAYTVIAAGVWERGRVEVADAVDLHRQICGEKYSTIHSCPAHDRALTGFNKSCDDCWNVSHRQCIYTKCNTARRVAIAKPIVGGVLWLPMLPVWAGVRLGRGKKIGGKRYKGAERLAKDIAKLEREIYGEGK